ncbi:helix-turn-helix transcriptional regulator [Cerasicoccus frondis]|uniref:helix-turn-helix transcriptional regulator n=1 Tax=Cerasicoccus frondis TaxID=490090 RepID=UPI0028524D9B|nr:AraC family transcriptional regulator [Cerasicoccus frondis]
MHTASVDFPAALKTPNSYYSGIGQSLRPVSHNVVVFMRTDRSSLQQKHFSNRSHHRFVFMLVLDTPGSVIVDGAEIPLRANDAFLVRPFQFHHYINIEADKLRWLFITFDLSDAGARIDDVEPRVMHQDQDSLCLWCAIAELSQQTGSTRQEELLPVLDRLLLRFTKQERALPAKPGTPVANSWIVRAQTLVLQAIEQGWTLDVVARKIGLSERQFRNRFEQETGVTIRHYRANYQLHQAMAFMRDSRLSLGEIAERVGFNSSAAFTRFIQREMGCSPLELRRRKDIQAV